MIFFISVVLFFVIVNVQSAQESHGVVVHHPYQHQQVISDTYLGLEYGIIKGKDNTPNDNIEIKFQWSRRDNTSTASPLQLDVHQGYSTRVIGTHQQHYSYHWKTPSCPFFIRYHPRQYHFSLIFLIDGDKSTTDASPSSMIRIPLDFTVVNVTGLHCNNKIINPTRVPHSHHNATSSKLNHQ